MNQPVMLGTRGSSLRSSTVKVLSCGVGSLALACVLTTQTSDPSRPATAFTNFEKRTLLQPMDSAAGDNFGYNLVLSADAKALVVGSHLDDNSGGADAGNAYVFTQSGSAWIQQTRLQASDAATGDLFGISIAISSDGRTLAIGAHFDDNSGGADAGSVYVFTRSGRAWTEQRRLQAGNAAADDHFGTSVAFSADGTTLAVGAHFDDNSGGVDAGSVYVFTRSGYEWIEQTRLQVSDAAASDYFGVSVSFSSDGTTLGVSAYGDDNSGGADAGSVYVFTRFHGVWNEWVRIQASDAAAGDTFGTRIAFSSDGHTLAAGAYFDDNIGGVNAGSVYVFGFSNGMWIQLSRLQATDAATDAGFGSSVAFSADGNTLAVGAYAAHNSSGAAAGAAYVFTRARGVWTQVARLQASDSAAGDSFGCKVALSSDGNTLLAGAYGVDSQAGTDAGGVYTFR